MIAEATLTLLVATFSFSLWSQPGVFSSLPQVYLRDLLPMVIPPIFVDGPARQTCWHRFRREAAEARANDEGSLPPPHTRKGEEPCDIVSRGSSCSDATDDTTGTMTAHGTFHALHGRIIRSE